MVVQAVLLVTSTALAGTLAGPPAAPSSDVHGHDHGELLSAKTPTARASQMLATGEIQLVPEVADGFALQPLAPVHGVSVITFGPGQDLYAASLAGQVLRYSTVWTQGGPVVQDVEVLATGFNLPQGIAFDEEGTLYVSDVRPAEEGSADGEESVGRAMGRVTEIDPDTGDRAVIVDGLPNGQHNTNHIRFGPDDRLYLPNGNPNDHGNGTGTGHTDIFPYSGAFLAVDVNGVAPDQRDTTPSDPAILHWRDDQGDRIPDEQIPDHPRNDAFAEQVDVFAHGFRNIYGVTFAPEPLPFAGAAYTGMNGAQMPAESQDVVYKIEEDEHHGFPFCYDRGDPGATGEAIAKAPNPDSPNPDFPCEGRPTAEAMLGWHVCATGVDFPPHASSVETDAVFPQAFRSSLFVAECGPLSPESVANQTVNDQASTHNTGHKVARLPLNDTGVPTGVRDLVNGLQAPTDVQFGPDGAMYIADADVVYRVFPTVDAGTPDATVPVASVGQSFAPQVVVVPEGSTVRWIGDVLPHTVTTSDEVCKPHAEPGSCQANDPTNGDSRPNTFHKQLGSSPANTVSHTFTEEGVYPYYCQIHYALGMVGMVIVADPDEPGGIGADDVRDAIGVE